MIMIVKSASKQKVLSKLGRKRGKGLRACIVGIVGTQGTSE